MQEIGTVISSESGPNSTEFWFVLNDNKGVPVRKGQFIQLNTQDGILVARVEDIIKTNRYYQRAESVSEFERSGRPLVEQFPVDRWEYLIAHAHPLGIFADGKQRRVTFPPSPGNDIYPIDESLLHNVLGLDVKSGLDIGKIEFHNVDAKLNVTRLFQKHLAILAMSGAGKCLSPDALITASSGQMFAIGSFIDSFMSTNHIKKEGNIEFCKINDLEVITLRDNKISNTKVKAVTRRKAPPRLLKITTNTGKTLTITKEHPLLTLDKKPIWKSANSLRKDRWIALPSIITTRQEVKDVNLAKEFKNEDEFYASGVRNLILELKNKSGLDWKTLAEKLRVGNSTLQYWRESGNIPIKRLYQLADISKEDIDDKIPEIKFKTSDPIKSKIKIDGNFARFLGYLFGDGHNTQKTLIFTNSQERIIKDFCSLSEKFIKKPYLRKKENTFECFIFNETLAQTLCKIFGLKNSSRLKDIPECIMESPNIILVQFIRALVDCDGYCSDNKPEIELVVSNKKVVPKIENILLRFGIFAVVKMKKSVTDRGELEYFYFYIRGVDNLRKFSEIGFNLSYKQRRLDKHLKLVSNPNIDVIPSTPILGEVIANSEISQGELGRISGVQQSSISRFISNDTNFSKDTFNKIITSLKEFQMEFLGGNTVDLSELNKLNHADIFWDKIKDVEEIAPDFDYVYDLVLEDSHNFIANNVIVHNSYLTSVLIEEILNRDRSTRPSVILIDPHGEYGSFAQDEKYRTSTKVYEGEKVTISTNSLSAYQLSILQPKISAVQRRELNPVIRKLREEKRTYNMGDLIEAVLNSEIKDAKTKSVLASWLHELEYTGLFSNRDYPSIKDLAYQGNLSIFDLSNIVDIKRKQIIVSYFAWKLFEARRRKNISPFVLFVEEAHQFAPENKENESAISRNIIEQIAREGRKFNACLTLVTQRPAGLSTTALSQCNTHIIMRVTNPYDLDHIKESSEGITGGVLDSIPGLKVGEAYIVGEAVNYPILVNVRERKSKASEKGMKLEDEILNFNNSKIDDKDLETFM